MKLQCVKLTCEGILILGLATISHVVEWRRKKKEFVVYATKWTVTVGFIVLL